MRPHMVIKETEFDQRVAKSLERQDRQLIETGFQQAKETFNASVLLRAMQTVL